MLRLKSIKLLKSLSRSTIIWITVLLVAPAALAGTWVDKFEDPAFTQRSWEIVQGEWEIQDGWWEAFSEATAKPGILAVTWADIKGQP